MNRELAIECIKTQRQFVDNETREAIDYAIYLLEKQSALDEWCTDCKEYDKEKHCCPRWNRVIREALKDARPEIVRCHKCIYWRRDTVRRNSNDAGWWNEAICERYSDEIWESWKDADWYCADAERRPDE